MEVVGAGVSLAEGVSLLVKIYRKIKSACEGYVDDEDLKVEQLKEMFRRATEVVATKEPKMQSELQQLVRRYMCKISRNLDWIWKKVITESGLKRRRQLLLGTKSKVKEKLVQTQHLVNDLEALLSGVETEPHVYLGQSALAAQLRHSLDEELDPVDELIKELSNPRNTQALGRKELDQLKARGDFVLKNDVSIQPAPSLGFVLNESHGADAVGDRPEYWFEEKIPLASDTTKTKQRRDRLLRLLHILQDSRVINIASPQQLVQTPRGFLLQSRTQGNYLLANRLGHVSDHDRRRLMLSVTQALHGIHGLFLLHKALHCFHVVVDNGFQAVQLVGFISSRVSEVRSDTIQTSDEDVAEARRELLYQAPERNQVNKASYSFACDIYSLGVLLLEIFERKCFFDEESIQGPEDILEVARTDPWLQTNGNPLGGLILDCLQRDATNRPITLEVLQLLQSDDFIFPDTT